MIYDRLDLDTGALLDREVFKHIDDSFETLNEEIKAFNQNLEEVNETVTEIEGDTTSTMEQLQTVEGKVEEAEKKVEKFINDLYNPYTTYTFEKIWNSTNDDVLQNADIKAKWETAIFNGWISYGGKEKAIDRISFLIKGLGKNYPISTINIEFRFLKDLNDITFNEDTNRFSPLWTSWELLQSFTFTLEKPIKTNGWQVITVDLPITLRNDDEQHLMMGVRLDNFAGWGFVRYETNDIPYNPGFGYSSSLNSSTWVWGIYAALPYDKASTEVWSLPCIFYSKEKHEGEIIVDTSAGGNFYNLVEETMGNSKTLGALLDPVYSASYAGYGSQDLFINQTTTLYDPTSTFTGLVFPIGVVPKDISIQGVRLKVSPREYNGVTDPATNINVYLYTVDKIPYTSLALKWTDLNPILVCFGNSALDNLAVEKTAIVDISFDNEFKNESEKFLMLGYNLDTYNNHIYAGNGLTTQKMCEQLDGNIYEDTMDSFYTVSPSEAPSWAPRWRNQKASAYSLSTITKGYGLGEGFKTIVKEIIENMDFSDEEEEEEDINYVPRSEVRLAQTYDLVVGDTFQMFYAGVVKSFMPEAEGINVICKKGYAYPRYFQWAPTADDIGEHTLKLQTRNFDGTIVSEGTTTLVVHPKLTNNTVPDKLNVLCFGDSLTTGGQWPCEGLRRIYGATNSGASGPTSLGLTKEVNAYGKKTSTVNTFTASHEGYGGWTWGSFLATANVNSTTNGIFVVLENPHNYDLNTVQKSVWIDNNGKKWELEDFPDEKTIKFNRGEGNTAAQKDTVLPTSLSCEPLGLAIVVDSSSWESGNPFYNEITSTVDFANHAAECDSDPADIVACLLTWNGGGGTTNGSFDYQSKIDTQMSSARTLLNTIHETMPKAKVIVMGIQINSLTGGCANNYGANGGYADMWGTAFYAFDYNQALENLIIGEFSDFCYYIDTKGQFDTLYNMPYRNYNVNTRNSALKENLGTNGVHPDITGYYQIGDAFYRALHKVIPTLM